MTATKYPIVEKLRAEGKDAFAKHYSIGMHGLCSEAADIIETIADQLSALLMCPEIADCDPRDKDQDTQIIERDARAALAKLKGEA